MNLPDKFRFKIIEDRAEWCKEGEIYIAEKFSEGYIMYDLEGNEMSRYPENIEWVFYKGLWKMLPMKNNIMKLMGC